MAKPRIFVSSTYYDLKHVRSSLDIFIESFGYDSVLSEKGNIAYSPDMPLEDSCYKEVTNADVFILIIGGRYGSETRNKNTSHDSSEFYKRYESVTKLEYKEALKKDIPTYILIEQSVYSEYQTFLKNKDNTNISYAHVDNVNIFKFIEEILLQPKNNPTHTFEKFSDIEVWLREQWSGLFRELLKRLSSQKRFTELSHQVEGLKEQVDGLKEINTTLKNYLESVINEFSPNGDIIEKEIKRRVEDNPLYKHLSDLGITDIDDFIEALKSSESITELVKNIDNDSNGYIKYLLNNSRAIDNINSIRDLLKLNIFEKPKRYTNIGRRFQRVVA